MSYVERNLIPGEQVFYKTGLHWIVMLWSLFFAVILGVGGLYLVIRESSSNADDQAGVLRIVGFALLLAAVVCFLAGYVKRSATEMVVTNKRILIKTGVLQRRTLEMLLSKVESIVVEENVPGRILGYGSVIVHGTGGTPEPFMLISHPLEFRRQVQQQIEHRDRDINA